MKRISIIAIMLLLIATTHGSPNKQVKRDVNQTRDTIVQYVQIDGVRYDYHAYQKAKLLNQLGLTGVFNETTYLLKRDKYYIEISNASKEFGIDRHLIEAVIICESRWGERARSKENAVGLMQVLDGPTDPKRNIRSGTAILANYIEKCNNDLLMGLTAYNMGVAGAKRHGKPNGYAYKVFKMWFYLNYINS